jgi:hypothetical protein
MAVPMTTHFVGSKKPKPGKKIIKPGKKKSR